MAYMDRAAATVEVAWGRAGRRRFIDKVCRRYTNSLSGGRGWEEEVSRGEMGVAIGIFRSE